MEQLKDDAYVTADNYYYSIRCLWFMVKHFDALSSQTGTST